MLLALGWLASQDVPAQARTPGPDPVAFDRLVEAVERGDRVITSPQEIRGVVQELDALRPREDAMRELRLRGFRCDYDDLGPPASGLAYARAGLSDARRLQDVGSQIRFLLCEGHYIDGSGLVSQSIVPVEAALALARKHEDPRLLAQALAHRGGLRSLVGEQAAALGDFLDAQRALSKAGLKKEAEAALQDIAVAYRRMGDHAKALEYLRQSVAFAEREGYWSTLTIGLLQTAFLHEDLGRLDESLAVLRRVSALALQHGLEYDAAAAQLGMASVLVKKGQWDAAELALSAASDGFDRLADRSNEGMLHLVRGQVHAGRGDHAGAIAQYLEAGRAFDIDPNLRYQVDLYAARSLSQEALGNYRAALNDLKLERSGRRKLNEDARTQQSLLLQYQFDTARRDLQNAQLQSERRNQQKQLAMIRRANRWQAAALVSFGLLLVGLVIVLVQQHRRTRRIHALALTDALTGVANRRHLEAAAAEAVSRSRADHKPLSVLTFDLDCFKRINDNHGHACGDRVLVRIVRECEAALRQGDLLGRIGGEEFVVLLPDTAPDHAMQVAERLRESIERLDLSDIAADIRVTISLGLALLQAHDHALGDVIDRADAALYRAKAAGRNRVEVEA
ncbi:GGDEF domain-containing protein [Agrilutibacter solisilvae]|uniref:diguanylate cyclase n=1 Tax=Agrilutibacter solisilvae TaxID=2763317 RepID=A0A974Y091_9GAMM|nr:GGDEF domain-containing protein [Lysobacter solisilvae]QSX79031.1 GGDEF domain-containing protein [Lysobacter solisilvae]